MHMVYMHVCVCVCIYIYIYITCMCVCVYIYIYICKSCVGGAQPLAKVLVFESFPDPPTQQTDCVALAHLMKVTLQIIANWANCV